MSKIDLRVIIGIGEGDAHYGNRAIFLGQSVDVGKMTRVPVAEKTSTLVPQRFWGKREQGIFSN